jgi:hypothetical protein
MNQPHPMAIEPTGAAFTEWLEAYIAPKAKDMRVIPVFIPPWNKVFL